MSCGMVRKIDELGRVVLPKEMRRILNIKTGSSVEMNINNENKIVISKFSEIENVSPLANILGQIVFEQLDLSCFICDDEKVLYVFGANKKDFLHKKINENALKNISNCNANVANLKDILEGKNAEQLVNVFFILNQGVKLGYVIVLRDALTETERQKIGLLIDFLTKIMD